MTDKLIELIKEYGKLCGLDRGSSYDILTNKQENELNDSTDKAKQAIIDYHDKKVEDATKHVRDRIKRILFKMWQRVENGQFDSRSFVGDTALSLRDTLYPPSENEIEIFWKEYKTWQAIKKDLEGK